MVSLVQDSTPTRAKLVDNNTNGLSPQIKAHPEDLSEAHRVSSCGREVNPEIIIRDVVPVTTNSIQGDIADLSRRKTEATAELDSIQRQVDSKFEIVAELRKSIVQIKLKRNNLADYLEIASKSQVEVRNLLNQIYNPGEQLAAQAKVIMDERRKDHTQKFEKLSFEMNQLIEGTREAIKKKMESLTHENELHQRTIIALGFQKMAEEEKLENITTEQEDVVDEDAHLPVKPNEEQVATSELTEDGACKASEDDCIIIDDQISEQTGLCQDSVQTPENNTQFESESDKNHNVFDSTNLANQYDDETTDIEEQADDDQDEDGGDRIENSFTPCQAQRLS